MVVKHMVDGHHRQGAGHQLHHLGAGEMRADDAYAVDIAVAAVLQVGHAGIAHVVGDEGDVVPAALRLGLEGLKDGAEKAVGETAFGIVGIQHAKVKCAAQLEAARLGVGAVAQLLGGLAHLFAGFLADIGISVERLAHGGYGEAAVGG